MLNSLSTTVSLKLEAFSPSTFRPRSQTNNPETATDKQGSTRPNRTVGTGKPEKLKHNLSGLWSRRISQKDRLIHKFDENYIHVFAIGGHYLDH
jgi:toxin YoeB